MSPFPWQGLVLGQAQPRRDGLQALMRQRDFMAQRARAAQAGASGPQQGEYGV